MNEKTESSKDTSKQNDSDKSTERKNKPVKRKRDLIELEDLIGDNAVLKQTRQSKRFKTTPEMGDDYDITSEQYVGMGDKTEATKKGAKPPGEHTFYKIAGSDVEDTPRLVCHILHLNGFIRI